MVRLLARTELVHELFSTSLVLYSFFTTVPVDIRELTTNLHILYMFHSFSASQAFCCRSGRDDIWSNRNSHRGKYWNMDFVFRAIPAHDACGLPETWQDSGFYIDVAWDFTVKGTTLTWFICAIPPLFRVSDHSPVVFCVTSWLVQAFENVLRMFARTKSLRVFFDQK